MLKLFALISFAAAQSNNFNDLKSVAAIFDPRYSSGLSGSIEARYKSSFHPMSVDLRINLDFSKLDPTYLTKLYPKCKELSFAWHVHTDWKSSLSSSVSCPGRVVGGHYDPTFACGPKSQYANYAVCKYQNLKRKYQCNPRAFYQNSIACEMGDLSGKFGLIKANGGKISAKYHDFFFPTFTTFGNRRQKWSIVLHLACPEHKNPKVFCAGLSQRRQRVV